MILLIPRRKALIGAAALICAPAIVRAQLLTRGVGEGNPGAAVTAQSLVLAAASSQYLSGPSWGTATNANKATLAYWVKLASVPGSFTQHYDGGNWDTVFSTSLAGPDMNGSDVLRFGQFSGGGQPNDFTTLSTNTISDTTTWHHLCFSLDSTQATAANRVRIYLDGVEVSYDAASTYIPQNQSFQLTKSGIVSAIGRSQWLTSRYFDGKISYFYLIDGQALTPSSLTTGTGAGTIHPAAYGGTFGTNGFFLNFSGSNANDSSGNNNNWTANNTPTYSADIPT